MQITDVLSIHAGRIVALGDDDQLYQASPELVAELAPLKARLSPEAFALKALVAATLRPEDFSWLEFPASNPTMVKAELKYSARYLHGWLYRTNPPTQESR